MPKTKSFLIVMDTRWLHVNFRTSTWSILPEWPLVLQAHSPSASRGSWLSSPRWPGPRWGCPAGPAPEQGPPLGPSSWAGQRWTALACLGPGTKGSRAAGGNSGIQLHKHHQTGCPAGNALKRCQKSEKKKCSWKILHMLLILILTQLIQVIWYGLVRISQIGSFTNCSSCCLSPKQEEQYQMLFLILQEKVVTILMFSKDYRDLVFDKGSEQKPRVWIRETEAETGKLVPRVATRVCCNIGVWGTFWNRTHYNMVTTNLNVGKRTVSILGREEGYTVKYGPSLREILRVSVHILPCIPTQVPIRTLSHS